MKRVAPYTRLLEDVKSFAFKVKYPKRTTMWVYPREKLATASWKLADLDERIKAGDQLGYDVMLISTDQGLVVKYIKRVEVPYRWAS